MVVKVAKQKGTWDYFYWGLICIVVVTACWLYFASVLPQSLLIQTISAFGGIVVVLLLAAKTSQGVFVIKLGQEAMQELKKVVWPTKKETGHATLAVFAMVTVMGFILWLIDSALLSIVARFFH